MNTAFSLMKVRKCSYLILRLNSIELCMTTNLKTGRKALKDYTFTLDYLSYI